MRCNACWQELEGRAITTTCGHLLCSEDASKILSGDGACPICDQVLSKSLMKPVDIDPGDEYSNMAMAGISPQILMKTAYKSIMFYIGQKELEMQYKMNRVVAQCRQKCEIMHEKFSEKMEQVYTAYQKLGKRCQMMEKEIESLSKDKQELQEQFAEKSKQKRELEEMYDQLRSQYESLKHSAIQPVNNFMTRADRDLFSNPGNMMGRSDSMRKGTMEDVWPSTSNARRSDHGPFDISSGTSPVKHSNAGNRGGGVHPAFAVPRRVQVGNPSMTLHNTILSPIMRPKISRSQRQLFKF